MFGSIETSSHLDSIGAFESQNTKIAGIVNELSTIFNGGGINPSSHIVGSSENGFSIQGGTFVADSKVHAGLANKLDAIYEAPSQFGSSEISGGSEGSREVKVLKKIKQSVSKTNSAYTDLSTMVQTKIQNLDSLKTMLEKTFNKLYALAKEDTKNEIHAEHIRSVQTKVMLEFDRQLGILQNILKVNIKPTQKNLMELLKKNADFLTLAETLGVAYGDETASDRLALVFTNISDVSIMSNKVKEALKELDISFSEYKNIKNSKELSDALYSVFKKFNKKKLNTTQDLTSILEAMNVLKTAQGEHDNIISNLQKLGRGDSSDSDSSSSSSCSDNDKLKGMGEIDGGAYEKEIGRQVKTRLKSSLSKRVQVYEKTMKELYRGFMNQINNKFKSLVSLIDLLTTKVGSEISYDDDLKDFIKMFLGFNENISNEKIFYSLIQLDSTVAGKELRSRFVDNLDKIIKSSSKLHNYSVFKDITHELKELQESIDTMSDTVVNLKKSEEEKRGSSDFMWTDKLLEQSFSMNNIKLIKESIKRLAFYSKVATIKENLHRMNKEQKLYQEDYDKLLGKSIGLKLTELQKEYVENVDRLNDKTRGRGRLLEQHNQTNPAGSEKHLPRGLVETIYKLQYEAKDGLYRSLEAIDLYLMNFTEQLSAHPEAVMDLNKMLEQTDIIAKWFTKKSVDNMLDLLNNHIDSKVNTDDQIDKDMVLAFSLPPLVQNAPIMQNNIKMAFERTKKCIDSIAVLKNIISMFVHLGEKYGNVNLTDKLHISPNMIYKHLVKYIWVSAFTMGYETGGGDKSVANKDSVNKGYYEPEMGDFDSFFNILFTTIVMPLDTYKAVEARVLPELERNKADSKPNAQLLALATRLRKDIFIIDDRYFILGLKAMIGKIFTVVDTHTLLQTPDTLAHIMRNPVRMIIGAGNIDVIPEAIELYIRLPLLVEFYKSIFEDGNLQYKNNVNKDSELEVIAYIPEIGTVWSGLIQCIFDESKYIKDGIYSINNMKDIVNEVNKIYNSYKSTPKDKLVRTVVLDLVSEINRRYGILKQKDIAEFYQIKKKYIKNVVDSQFEDNVNFDILDENNEYERSAPSSQFVESSFNKYSNDSLVFTDIKLVRDFRNNIYNQLFGDEKLIGDLSTKSFNEKIKHFKNQIVTSESHDAKFELIAQAIDQSSNINAYNVDAYLLYHELVQTPLYFLKRLREITTRKMSMFYTATTATGSSLITKLELLDNLYKHFNDGILFKVKQISNNRFIIDFSTLQTQVELYIENIKYMISKFRNLICRELINSDESDLYLIENAFLNITIKNDASVENYDELKTLDYFNKINTLFLESPMPIRGDELYAHIMFGDSTPESVSTINNTSHQLLQDIDKAYDATTRTWSPKNSKFTNFVFSHTKAIDNDNSFENKSILQKFNMLVFSYLEQFYNSSTKKIYTKLIDEFANKAMSSAIFEQGGIPDMYGPSSGIASADFKNGILENSTVLSMTTVMTLRTLLTRTLNIQLPVKYHLIDTISEVSTIQVEKYKAYLPSFITYFEHLIEECIVYKKLLDNPTFKFLDLPTVENPATLGDNTLYKLTDDFNTEILFSTKFVANNKEYNKSKNKYDEVLNNIINGSRALINDATNVLNELNDTPQFGNIRDNFIKNFYNNNRQLPYLPLSLLTPVLDNKSPINLLPVHYINTNENKYIYGTNVVLNSNTKEDINQYLWLKEQLKIYNNGVLSTNNIEVKKVNQYIEISKDLVKSNYLNAHVNYNIWWRSSTSTPSYRDVKSVIAALLSSTTSPPSASTTAELTELKAVIDEIERVESKEKSTTAVAESKLSKLTSLVSSAASATAAVASKAAKPTVAAALFGLLYSYLPALSTASTVSMAVVPYVATAVVGTSEIGGGALPVISTFTLEKLINIIENQLNENKKHSLVSEILGTTCTKDPSLREYNLDRSKARILNIIDLNINPINVHALMREVPLVNIYNYAFTFDNVIKSFVYNVDPDDFKFGTSPSPDQVPLFKLSCLLQDPYFIDTSMDKGVTPRALLQNALDMSYKPTTSYDPNSSLYLAAPKYTHNIFDELNKRYNKSDNNEVGTLYHNNKFLRNVLFLVNAQRVIRLKIKKAVYRINTNIVSDTNILNMRITDYPESSDMTPKDDEFEITDLF